MSICAKKILFLQPTAFRLPVTMLKSLLCAMMLVTSFASIMAQQTSSLNDWLIVPGSSYRPFDDKD